MLMFLPKQLLISLALMEKNREQFHSGLRLMGTIRNLNQGFTDMVKLPTRMELINFGVFVILKMVVILSF